MAGTDTSQQQTQAKDIALAPAIILVEPQLGENIGMCARAMLNCAVTELRIVKPRDGWPNERAISSSSGATELLDNAKIFDSVEAAIADLEFVLATTARPRGMVKDIYHTDAAATEIRKRNAAGVQKCGILFGRERTGLENDDIAQANAILNIPLNPGFSSLNLAQAVLLVCFSWLSADNPFSDTPVTPETGDSELAKKEEIDFLMKQLDEELTMRGFFRSPDQKPTTWRNIQNFFYRSAPTQQDVRTLHGIISSLTGKRGKKQD